MFWKDEYSDDLVRIMKKLKKKDKVQYEALCKKRDEILEDPLHYKNLQYDLYGKKRVHVYSSFVLVYAVDLQAKTVRFLDYDHHDIIYKKSR